MIWVALGLALVVSVSGIALAAITLPGIWLIALGAVVAMLIAPGSIGWWGIGALVALAALGELVDFLASALGSNRLGGTRAGAIGSVLGTLAGAIMGSFVLPILGSIVGGVVGAGVGAVVGERGVASRSWRDSVRSGGGAATGRLVSMVVKVMLAGAAGALFVAIVTVNAF